MANYTLDPDMPKILRNALIASDNEYQNELKEYLNGQDKGIKFKISATAISKPTQSIVLFSRHNKDLWIDPEKCWHALKGNVIHYILEKEAAKLPEYISEQRMGVDIEIDGDLVHVHGKMDVYNKETEYIEDWKNTSASSMGYDKEDHRMQLNILYYILRKNGYTVNGLRDIYLFDRLDPTKTNMPGYPKRHYQVVEVEKMPLAEIKAHIIARVRKLRAEHLKPDKKLTLCTDEERWIRGSLFKLYTRKKGGRKGELQPFSSMAACSSDDMADLEDFIKKKELTAVDDGEHESNYYIKEIKGIPKACDYCAVNTVCRQRLKEVLERDKEYAEKNK